MSLPRVFISVFVPGTFGASLNSSASLCNGKAVVSPQADWVWNSGAAPSPSCTNPPVVNNAQMCEGDPTSVVLRGSGKAECLSAHMDCVFNMHDLVQLDFDVQMINCKNTWAAPLWMSPNHWEGGGWSGEIDMLENCPSDRVQTNFAGGGQPKAWGNPDDYTAHTTMWKQDDGNGIQSIHVKSCPHSELKGGSCPETGTAYFNDIYGKNGCSKGDCMYKLISDIWNGYSGDGGFQSCSHGKPHYGSGCMTSITNIRTRGIPFSGKCAALSHGPTPTPPPPSPPTPTPPSSLVSISSRKSGKCLDLAGGEEKNGAILQVWSCQHTNPDANQRWSRRGNEIVHHSSRGGELCVDMTDNNPTDGNHLQVWSCGGTPQQQWVQSGDKFRVGNACMDLRDGKMSDGAKVQVWNCNSPTPENQQWVITPIGGDNSVLV